MIKKTLLLVALGLFVNSFYTQQERWQQEANYKMDINVDVEKHQYSGTQVLEYTNNSNEELNKVFYHLFFNAFQPGSMMDTRSRTIIDPDSRVGDRIFNLPKEEQGWIEVKSLTMDGKKLDYTTAETILEVELKKSIKPGQTVTFEMTWDAQVPRQIRRSGWENKEGVEYTMTQWYPKICEYDYEGWHSNPYVGREFHGVWGNYEVNITMPSEYTLGFTGVLTNPKEIGKGYGPDPASDYGETLTWKIKADNVIDFAWAADVDYIHDSIELSSGTTLHFLYKDDEEIINNWNQLQDYMDRAFKFLNENFGEYPYPQYSFIQGGDGGMEYPMCTMITGERSLPSLVGVSVHEAVHSWFQGVLASNESLYEWMDEGFTSYASAECMKHLFNSADPAHAGSYEGYKYVVRAGIEEPMSTHADHYSTNTAYGIAAYSKGEVLLEQLKYVIGEKDMKSGMLIYYDTWKFKHPNPTDFKRIMEKESGLELDWYFQYFTQTTDTIDYAITSVTNIGKETEIELSKIGKMPMPLDVVVTYKNGSKEMYYIPLVMMRGEKDNEFKDGERIVEEDWPWTNPTFTLSQFPKKCQKSSP